MSSIKSWASIPSESGFTVENLPFGIFSTQDRTKRVGVAIGEEIIDLSQVYELNFLQHLNIPAEIFKADSLNPLMALGRTKSTELRKHLQSLLHINNESLKEVAAKVLVSQSEATMHMPVQIGDYTDFYSTQLEAFASWLSWQGFFYICFRYTNLSP